METIICQITVLSTNTEERIFVFASGHRTPARRKDMEAIIIRGPATRQLESAAAEWLHATLRLARTVARATWEELIRSSRAALLVENGSRPRRRF
jgi:hypothetical protein